MSDFFDRPADHSIIKGDLVFGYFKYWVSVMRNVSNKNIEDKRLGYIDLYSGPGKYEDGTPSTPVKIVEEILRDDDLIKRMVFVFNDKNAIAVKQLEENLKILSNYEQLTNKPSFDSFSMESEISAAFKDIKLIPSLIFLDPFGIKGLSKALFENIRPNFGCDLITFFNFSFTNRSTSNNYMDEYINDLFGKEEATELRKNIYNRLPAERQDIILSTYIKMLKSAGWKYVLTFRIKKDNNHIYYIVFVTKDSAGVRGMKAQMSKCSTSKSMNPLCFYTYNFQEIDALQGLLNPSFSDLKTHLSNSYSGKTYNRKELYEMDSINTPFIEKEYRLALLEMETDGKIIVNDVAKKHRRKNTLAEDIKFCIL